MRDAPRTLRRAAPIAIATVTVLYVLANIAYVSIPFSASIEPSWLTRTVRRHDQRRTLQIRRRPHGHLLHPRLGSVSLHRPRDAPFPSLIRARQRLCAVLRHASRQTRTRERRHPPLLPFLGKRLARTEIANGRHPIALDLHRGLDLGVQDQGCVPVPVQHFYLLRQLDQGVFGHRVVVPQLYSWRELEHTREQAVP